jgi:ribosomal protein S18 acetylase RimI-like enzyme
MPIEIQPLREAHLERAAALFVQKFKQQRQAVPQLPASLADPAPTLPRLEARLRAGCALAALDKGRLLGYLAWYLVDDFRSAGRKGAYVPVWGHAAGAEDLPAVYAALYRAAATSWTAAGCQVHCISLPAYDQELHKVWFWNGFGLAVVDAVRSLQPLGAPLPTELTIRKASVEDAEALAVLEQEHWRHYAAAPILMAETKAPTAAPGFREFLQQPHNSVWWALSGAHPAGFMRFEGHSHGATELVQSPDTIAITGAYTRPAYRGLGAAPALLDAALQHYAAQGFARCAVDFESFNPEAARFWMKYFDPVVFSLMRHPEVV